MMKARSFTKKTALLLCAAALALVSGLPGAGYSRQVSANAAPPAPAAALTVNASNVVAPFKREMLGTNIGLWTNSSFHPVSKRTPQYVNMMKEAGISLIRFPAGAEADYAYWDRTNSYEWHVGPSPYIRTITASIFDSYMSLVREVGAEPMVTVNAKIDDAEMAADMVRYANVEKGYNIKYWEIGNEPEFFAAPHAVTPLEYAARIKAYSEAMKAVDPSIIIIGPANAQPTQFQSWTKPILSYLHDNNSPVDGISTHWYPLWGGQTNTASSSYPSIDNLLAYDGPDYANSYIKWANEFTDTTPTDNLISYRDAYTNNAIVGITELGQVTGGSEGAGIGNTMAGALWLGDVLGRLAYHQMDFVNQFLFQGNQAYALMDMNKNVRPAYYLYPMFNRYFGDQMVESGSSDNQNFTIWASKKSGEDDKLYLMVINKNQTDSLSAAIDLTGFAPESVGASWTLNAPSVSSVSGSSINGVPIGADGTLPDIAGNVEYGISSSFIREFPAHSVTMLELTREGTAEQTAARYLGQFADGINERKTAADWPGNASDTPQGWGKIYRTGTAEWSVNLPKPGDYTFRVSAYGEGDNPSFRLRLDGNDIAGASYTPDASWSVYEGTISAAAAGKHTISILNDSGEGVTNVNVAYLEIDGAAPGGFDLSLPGNGTFVDTTFVTLNWRQNTDGRPYSPFGADKYTLIVADNPALTNPILHTTVSSTSFEAGPLEGETTYYWTVLASNANGATAATSIYSFTTPELVVPSSPARYPGRFASGMNERKGPTDWPGTAAQTPDGWGKIWRTATTEWPVYFPVTGEYNFSIRAIGEGEAPAFQVKLDGAPLEGASFSPGTAWNSYSGSFGTVSAGLHFVQVTNSSASGVTNVGIAHIDILGAAPGSFTLKSPANQSTANSTTVTLDWTQSTAGLNHAPFGAEQYRVIVADNAALEEPIVQNIVNGTTYVIENLAPSKTFYWTVVAMNANGATRAASVNSFTTPAHYVPVAPARYLAQYADTINERRTSANYPGSASATPQGWGKIYRTGTGLWTVNFLVGGTYNYTIEAYGEGATASFQVRLNGEDVPNGAFTPVGAWSDYQGSLTVPEAGTYTVGIFNNSATSGHNVNVAHLDIMGASPAPFALNSPGDGETVNTPVVTLDWMQFADGLPFAPQGAAEYSIVVADNEQFINPIIQTTTTGTSYDAANLFGETTYYWKVTAINDNGSTEAAEPFRFTTGDLIPPSLATLTGPSAALIGQDVAFNIGVSAPEARFTVLETVVSYDASRIEFATETNEDGQLVLQTSAVTGIAGGFQLLATGVKPAQGQIYILLARTSADSDAIGTIFNLNGKVKPNAQAGGASVSLAEATISAAGSMTSLGTGTASVTVQVALSDKSTLIAAINEANSLVQSALPGTQPGQYPTAAIVAYQAAISSATAVRDNPNATQSQVADAITALAAATQTFKSAVIPAAPADKTLLNAAIAAAEAKLAASVEGSKLGQFPTSAIQTFTAAINAAKSIRDKANATQAEVNSAAAELSAARTAFASSIVTLVPGQSAVSIRDLSILAQYYGTTSEDADWSQVEKADLFGNGEISIVELAAVARMIVNEWLEN